MQCLEQSLPSSWCLCRSAGPFPTKPHPELCHFSHPSRSPDSLAGLGYAGVVQRRAAVGRNMGCKLRSHMSYTSLDSWGCKNMLEPKTIPTTLLRAGAECKSTGVSVFHWDLRVALTTSTGNKSLIDSRCKRLGSIYYNRVDSQENN